MKINLGIVGYGNLGKTLEKKIITESKYNLIAIFSRRIVKSQLGTLIDTYENITYYKNKIDIMLLCGSSFSDLEIQTREVLKHFDCINSFDTHNKISKELKQLDYLAKETGHILIMSCGWDPGIFSNIRAVSYIICGQKPYTFWGRGVSMGHSNAIKSIAGVDDAISLTIPNKEAIILAKQNRLDESTNLHSRECFVVSKKHLQKDITKQITNLPNYFKNQPTTISFVSEQTLLRKKTNMAHKGLILSHFNINNKSKGSFEFKLSIDSNPDFTASVMHAYISAIINLKLDNKTGAFTPLDIPMSYLTSKQNYYKLIDTLC